MAKTSEMTQTMRIPRTTLEPDTEATTSEWGCPAALSRIDREVLGLSLPSRWQPRIFLLVALALVVPHHHFFLPKSLAADDPILTNENTSLTPQAPQSISSLERTIDFACPSRACAGLPHWIPLPEWSYRTRQ